MVNPTDGAGNAEEEGQGLCVVHALSCLSYLSGAVHSTPPPPPPPPLFFILFIFFYSNLSSTCGIPPASLPPHLTQACFRCLLMLAFCWPALLEACVYPRLPSGSLACTGGPVFPPTELADTADVASSTVTWPGRLKGFPNVGTRRGTDILV